MVFTICFIAQINVHSTWLFTSSFYMQRFMFESVYNSSVGTVTIRIIKLTHFDKPKMVSFKRNIILLFAIMSLMFNNVANITQRTICNYNIIRYTNTYAIITFILRFIFYYFYLFNTIH